MLSAFRRGPALARAFRACAPRSLQSAKISPALVSNVKTAPPFACSQITRSQITQVRCFQSKVSRRQADAATATAQSQDLPPLSEFSELATQGMVHPRIIETLTEDMKLRTMTEVQSLTIPRTVLGVDTLAKAKTGTGKTIAFLIPVLQKIITNDPQLLSNRARASSQDIRAIIISPTRELAEQIAVEGRKVAQNTGIVIQTAVGGTRKLEGLQKIKREGCHILVATPGRLKDILMNDSRNVSAPNLDVLVLDEADRLLDDGFGAEIEEIKDLLPDPTVKDRQTLMFSATVPREVMYMVRRSMKPGFEYLNTVAEDEVPTQLRVPQKVVFCRGFENTMPAILEILTDYQERAKADPTMRPLKAIIYYNTNAEVQLAHEAFQGLLNDPMDRRSSNPFGRKIYPMHSKLSQAYRTKFSDSFRRAQSAILISSDVTARGLDFPNVTHVIQVGVPRMRENYIHRLGRTGRANKEGEGWILIHDEEDKVFVERLGSLPIEQHQSLQAANVDMSKPDQVSGPIKKFIEQTSAAFNMVPYEAKRDAYRTQLTSGAVNFRRRQVFVDALNNLATYGWGLPKLPSVSSSVLDKVGMKGIRGLNVDTGDDRSRFDSRGSGDRFGDRTSRFSRPKRDRADWSDSRASPSSFRGRRF